MALPLLLVLLFVFVIPSCNANNGNGATPLWEINANDSQHMYFGNYPQRVATNQELDSIIATNKTDSNGYYLDASGNKYVKLTTNLQSAGVKFSNNNIIQTDTEYYFRVEKISWRILKKEGNTAVLFCDSILDTHAYGDGQNASITAWLNSTFMANFTSAEQAIMIADETSSNKVLLIDNETLIKEELFNNQNREKQATDYARANNAIFANDGKGWWLYSNGDSLGYVDYSGIVYNAGAINLTTGGIAPVISINLQVKNNKTTTYTVKHYKQTLNSVKTEDLTAEDCTAELEYKTSAPNKSVTPDTKNYQGFTAPSAKVVTIDKDGNTVVEYYYIRNSYTLTLTKGAGIESVSASGTGVSASGEGYSVKYGATVTLSATPSAGYSVNNWSATGNVVTILDNEYTHGVASAVELTINATANGNTRYTVEHYTENLDGTYNIKETENLDGTTGTTATATAKTIDGFTHDANNGERVESGSIVGDGSLVLKVYYARNTYTLTLSIGANIDAVTATGTGVTASGENFSVKYGATVTLSATPSTGYSLGTWISDDVTVAGGTYTHNLTSNVELSINATANTYTVTFSANATDSSISISSTNATVAYDTEIGALPTATRTDYEFDGWYVDATGTTQVTATTILNNTNFATIDHTNKTLTIYAKWTACNYSTAWESDETHHWHECTNCGGESTHQAHTFVDDKCSICQYVSVTQGLEYAFMPATETEEAYYKVTGMGTATAKHIKIPATYDDGTENGSHPVKMVDSYAFASTQSDLSEIESVTFSENMEIIGEYAFGACLNLTTVNFSNTVTKIDTCAFIMCSALASITLPDSLKEIGTMAFFMNPFTSINIPKNVETINDNPFMFCENLTTITVDRQNTKFHATNNCLIDTANKTILVGLYLANIPSDGTEVTTIGYGAFMSRSDVTSFEIPKNITTLEESAFDSCEEIVSVVIPVELTKIVRFAFRNCPALTTVFYAGTSQTQWDAIDLDSSGNSYLTDATRYYFSETEPTTEGKYWHYVNGAPEPWTEIVKYKVKHYTEKLDGSYELADTKNYTAKAGTTVNAVVITIDGFTHDADNAEKESGKVANDGSLVLEVYYTRNSYTLTINVGTNIDAVSATGTGVTEIGTGVTASGENYSVKYGATVTLSATPSTGYALGAWTGYTVTDNSFTMPAENVTLTANATANTNTAYTVEYYLQNIEDDDFTKDTTLTETKSGTTDEDATTTAKAIEGFTYDDDNSLNKTSGRIKGDGTLVLTLYYNRRNGNLLITKGDGINTVSATGTGVTLLSETIYKVKYGATVTLSATVKTGYTFKNWTKSSGGSEVEIGNTIEQNTPHEIYVTANAIGKTYSLTFDGNATDSTISTPANQNVTYGSAIGELPTTATRTGYTFDGWYTDHNCTYIVTDEMEVLDTTFETSHTEQTAIVYAKWTENTYTLTLNKGANIATVSTTGTGVTASGENYTVTYGSTVTLSATASTGYTFSGWTGYTLTGSTLTMPAQNVTITATATPNTNTAYKVEHYTEKLDGSYELANAETQNLTGTTGTTATATAKTIAGFTYDEDNSLNDTSGSIKGDGSLVLKLHYTRNSYTLTLAKGTGIASVSASGTYVTENTNNYTVKYGATVTLSATESTGYWVGSWSVTNNLVTVSSSSYTHNVASDVTITANGTARSYSLYYNTNGGSTISNVNKTYNTAFTESELPTPTKTGNTFAGWYNDANLTTKVNVGDAFTTATATIEYSYANIYAKWTEHTYTIVFNGNGNTSGTMSNLTLSYSESASLPTNAFVKTGSYFAGWATSASSSTVTYTNRHTVSELTATNEGMVNLYAVWTTSHTHSYNTAYIKDATYHWHECNCGEIQSSSKVEHTFKNGICNVCSYARDELAFSYVSSTETYTVTGIGRMGSYSSITVPATYDNGTNGSHPVTRIGDAAFKNKEFSSITLPDSITSIGGEAFRDCDNLTSIVIPKNVSEFGSAVFSYCSNLTSITVDDENENYFDIGNCVVQASSKTILAGCKASTIPENNANVTTIGYYAFQGISGITELVIPEGITGILQEAFRNCGNLTSISLPKSLDTLAGNPFSHCKNLESITINEENTTFEVVNNCLIYIEDGILMVGCNNSIIPTDGSILKIGVTAFAKCQLTNIIIPDSVEEIASYAFDSSKLQTIVIPVSVTTIGQDIIVGTNVTRIYYGGTKEDWDEMNIYTDNYRMHTESYRYYYSETQPTSEGQYWHWVNGKPTAW